MFPIDLPAEISILVLAYLPLSNISILNRINKEWRNLINQNGNTVYRNAAFLEGYIPSPKVMLDSLTTTEEGMERTVLYSRKVMRGVHDWRELCKRQKMIQRSWAGLGSSSVVSSPRTLPSPLPPNAPENSRYKRVHRIKIDEKVGIIITTTELGGLVVRDIEIDAVLWELPIWYVHSHAHLEYGEGYMIFDRTDGNKEVWRRTADIEAEAHSRSEGSYSPTAPERPQSSPRVDTPSPDHRQQHVANYIRTLAVTSPITPAQKKAHFSPHTVLQMPETTRAFRFVYPHLLVASLERAFVWDIRTGTLIQRIDNIQIVRPIGIPYEEEEQSERQEGSSSRPGLSTDPNAMDLEPNLPRSTSSPNSLAVTTTTTNTNASSTSNEEDEGHEVAPLDDNDDDEEDNEDEDHMPQFLGLIRYVDISPRHIFVVGRYLMRAFSRETGKCVLDIPSTQPRYGGCKWDLASRRSQDLVVEVSTPHRWRNYSDSYTAAKEERREVVRMPLEFTYEERKKAERMIIDQFIAVHASSDGKHLVAMLSGSRLVILHHFEDILGRHRFMKGSKRGKSHRQLKEEEKLAKQDRDRDVFDHIWDVQLGSPHASSSIYLAYEHGRIGVVTSNAVYIVSPTIPPLPALSPPTPFVPNLTVGRLPYFANPSWLGAVSCLMMSDTGLYLNWNPTAPLQLEQTDDEKSWESWEREYEEHLEHYELYEDDRYHLLPNGDMFVAPIPRALEISEVSTVFAVDFIPHS